MDHEPGDPMNDPALEREVESLLDVDPSPEFVARVRTRIASEPEPSRWRLAWVVVPAVGMCVVLFATVMVTGPRPEPAVPAQAVISSPVRPTIVEREPALEPRRVVARVATQKREQPAAVVDQFPEVVISEDERQAFEQLLLAIEQDRLPVLMRAGGDAEDSLAPAPLEIDPLTIEPLQVTRLE